MLNLQKDYQKTLKSCAYYKERKPYMQENYSLVKILERRDFYKTPDGQGYYTFKSRRYNGYIEVMTFDKIRSDAKKRNQILFDKLGLPAD